ncbi:maleylpyruvate isomerase family mycothiol-dependent enzyme [Pseudonocardia sp. CA-107938]|uniref:maleylpyruvate isomerase family mycothiol-dependent enzyme n=1 Tax=Pseudonocardia sp. CA-107938 TaxID=3240021 RepID=UPI003D8D0F7A
MGGREERTDPRTDPAATLAWAKDGAEHLRGLMGRLGGDTFAMPSGLPGWTRAHVLTHVARNADALINLLDWARTGVRTPAYSGEGQRNADIEAGARRSAAEIRADVVASSDRLADAVRAMPAEAWRATVEIRGHRIPVTDVLWLRAVETWVHAIDLDAGASFTDLPQPMLRALVGELASVMGERPDVPAMVLVATGEPAGRWTVGEPGADAPEFSGSAAELAAWLSGRAPGRHLRRPPGVRLPHLGRWR